MCCSIPPYAGVMKTGKNAMAANVSRLPDQIKPHFPLYKDNSKITCQLAAFLFPNSAAEYQQKESPRNVSAREIEWWNWWLDSTHWQKNYFYQLTPSMPIRSHFLIFVYKCVWISVPNQTEVYMLWISDLSTLFFLKKRQRKKGGFRLLKFPRWHSASSFLHQKAWDTPAPTHVVHNPRTCLISDQECWLPARLCGLWFILSGNAPEPTLQNSPEGEGPQLLSCCVRGNGHSGRIIAPTPPQTFQLCNYTTWHH